MWHKIMNWWRLLGKRNHHYHIRQSKKVLARLAQIRADGATEAQILAYLRKIHFTSFEELLLTVADRDGCRIIRNTRYSGDGGMDGKFIHDGVTWLIQAKRYSSAINPAHVKEFSALVSNHKCHGLFIHTGRTGDMSRAAANGITILSGWALVRVVLGEERLTTHLH